MAIAYKNTSRYPSASGGALPQFRRPGFATDATGSRRRDEAGITLVELLTVIVVVSILASLLFSALSSAQNRAKSVHCLSNLRELAQAQALYVSEQNAYPPANWFDPSRRLWSDHLNRILGARSGDLQSKTGFKGVFVCPSHVRRTPQSQLVSSYGYNAFGSGGGGLGGHFVAPLAAGQPPDHVPTSEADVAEPSQMLAMGDGYVSASSSLMSPDQVYPNTGGGLWETQIIGRVPQSRLDAIGDYLRTLEARKRHQERLNVVYCDGHAEPQSIRFLFFEKSDTALRRWNADHLPHREFWPQLP